MKIIIFTGILEWHLSLFSSTSRSRLQQRQKTHCVQTVHFVATWLFGSRKQACCTKLLCMADKGKISRPTWAVCWLHAWKTRIDNPKSVSKYSTKKAFDKSSSFINICITRYTCVYGGSVNEKPSHQ
jgi:hypothetical protein